MVCVACVDVCACLTQGRGARSYSPGRPAKVCTGSAWLYTARRESASNSTIIGIVTSPYVCKGCHGGGSGSGSIPCAVVTSRLTIRLTKTEQTAPELSGKPNVTSHNIAQHRLTSSKGGLNAMWKCRGSCLRSCTNHNIPRITRRPRVKSYPPRRGLLVPLSVGLVARKTCDAPGRPVHSD